MVYSSSLGVALLAVKCESGAGFASLKSMLIKQHQEIGVLEVYRSVDTADMFMHISSFNLPSSPRMLAWNQKAKIVAVGFESGDVMLLEYDPSVN